MNMKKIIKAIAKITAISGVAFVAYKLGETNGESRERIRQKYDEDDYYDFSDYDEPDCGCIKPSSDRGDKS